MTTVTVLGLGSWGTAVSQHLAKNKIKVNAWTRDNSQVEEINNSKTNRSYFEKILLSENINATSSLEVALKDSEALILCLPSSATREALEKVKNTPSFKKNIPIVSTAKGLEKDTNKRTSQVISEVLGTNHPIFVLSGPTFAQEVAKGLPSAVVLAHENSNFESELEFCAKLFHQGLMRVYTSPDLVGVELGGILKNVIAIAAGIGDGLKLGLNARAALLTRSLKELIRLIEAEGGNKDSVIGLSGLGDLILTATGDLSRNRTFGMLLGEGLSIQAAKEKIKQTIEAVTTAQSALELANKKGIEVPIIEQVAAILSEKTTPLNALQYLMTREQKAE